MAYDQSNDNTHQPSVEFNWDEIEPEIDTSIEVEQFKFLLLFLSSYIFLPNPNGGKRKDRQQVVSSKALAAFSVLLGQHMGGCPTQLLRASGLGISERNFIKHQAAFRNYINQEETSKKAINQFLSK